MSTYEKARLLAIDSLEKALYAHSNDEVLLIDDGLDEFVKLVPRHEISSNSLLYLTLEFWSGWSDSAIHGWYFYEPLTKDDWPRLAKILISDLKANREVSNIEILSKFTVYPKEKNSIFSKLAGLFRGKAI